MVGSGRKEGGGTHFFSSYLFCGFMGSEMSDGSDCAMRGQTP